MIKRQNKINERRMAKNYKSIFVTDIDETLLHSNFDDLGPTKWPDKQIQYSTITNGTPNMPILKIMDQYINDGYDVAFLTARSSYQTTMRALKKFLMYRDLDGNLQPIEDVLEDDFSFAVNDNEQHTYVAEATNDRKAEIVAQLCELYDDVVFADDSDSNLGSVKKLLSRYKNLTVIDAKAESAKQSVKMIKESADSTLEEIEQGVYLFLKEAITYMMGPNPIVDPDDGRFNFEIQIGSNMKPILNLILDDAEAYEAEGGMLDEWNIMPRNVGRSYSQFSIDDDTVIIEYKDNAIAMEIFVTGGSIEVVGEVLEMSSDQILVPLRSVINLKNTDIRKIR